MCVLHRKFISVNDAPLRGYRKARSARTASSSSGNKSLEKASSRKPKLAVDEPSGRDTIWRAEAPHHAHGGAGGSVYSLQKVAPKNGKGKAKDESTTLDNTPEEDEDRFGTVATYKTAQAGQPDGSDSNGDADSEDDDTPESGQATPTTLDRSLTEDSEEGGLDATIGKKGSRPGSGRRPVQDIWPSAKSSRKQQHVSAYLISSLRVTDVVKQSRAETELHKTLAMPDAEFAKLLTQ